MPPKRAAGLKICAAAMATFYLAPALFPGLSGLAHDVFHLVAEPVHVHVGSEAHAHPHQPSGIASHSHPHEHPEGGSAHTHTDLVDALLTADARSDDALEDAHAPAPESWAPGIHLPQFTAQVEPLQAGAAAAPSDPIRNPASVAVRPPTPPPRA